jgi:hypothetical protein
LEKAKQELGRIELATIEECAAMQEMELSQASENRRRWALEREEQKRRYAAMLDKAKRFVPPSGDHSDYAKFLVSQLEESIKFDCHESTSQVPERLSPDQWKSRRLADLQASIVRYQKEQFDEDARTASRNRWLRELRTALECD